MSCCLPVQPIFIRRLQRVWRYQRAWRITDYEKTLDSLLRIGHLVASCLFCFNSQFVRQHQVWDRNHCERCHCRQHLSGVRRWRSAEYGVVCCQCVFVLHGLLEEPKKFEKKAKLIGLCVKSLNPLLRYTCLSLCRMSFYI